MRTVTILMALVCLLALSPGNAQAASADLPAAKTPPYTVPDVTVLADLNPEQAAYLGLSHGTPSFGLTDIKADFLIVELFSMYCPHCQREAPTVNKLFEMLKASPHADRFRLLGIGVGNTAMEVQVFAGSYDITMPLAYDPELKAWETFSGRGTPEFFVVQPLEDGLKVLDRQEGHLPELDVYLERVFAKAGLE